MDSAQVQQILEQALNLQEIHVKGEGSHYEVIAVDAVFE
ncbi:BolA family iron metabolism protein IbaG, partial [Vibrio fluvialis]|nr:BolA family iron metabolism protein IbaG [Vibrio fluvialis]